jgi:hypothetical protein
MVVYQSFLFVVDLVLKLVLGERDVRDFESENQRETGCQCLWVQSWQDLTMMLQLMMR